MAKINLIIVVIIFVFINITACSQNDARLIINKESGKTQEGIWYVDVNVQNLGGQPAYFVLIMVSVIKDGVEIDYAETDIGDIFPNSEKNIRFTFPKLIVEPDDFKIESTYSQYGNRPI
jgi:uncharacterized protein (TIGR02588 family)